MPTPTRPETCDSVVFRELYDRQTDSPGHNIRLGSFTCVVSKVRAARIQRETILASNYSKISCERMVRCVSDGEVRGRTLALPFWHTSFVLLRSPAIMTAPIWSQSGRHSQPDKNLGAPPGGPVRQSQRSKPGTVNPVDFLTSGCQSLDKCISTKVQGVSTIKLIRFSSSPSPQFPSYTSSNLRFAGGTNVSPGR